jgi:hypothetical protein
MERGTEARADPRPRLVVTSAGSLEGAVLCLEEDDVLVGRDRSVDLRLDDPHISRIHARFRTLASGMVVQDLGSTGGTTVNGVPATDAIVVHPGDRIAFAALETRFEDDRAGPPPPMPAEPETPTAGSGSPPRRFDVGSQSAHQLNNVQGDQYIQHLHVERTAFVEELATMRSRGSRLLVLGFLLSIVGFSLYAYVIFRFMGQVQRASASTTFEDFELLGPPVAGVPLGAIGFGLFFLGSILIVVGVVQHVVAAARRRAWNRAHPEPGIRVLPGTRA